MVGILDIGAAGARRDESLDELLRRQPVAILEVRRHGYLHGIRDAPQRAERDVGRKMAVILIAIHGREGVARRGDCVRACGFDDQGTRRVPDVGQDQGIARGVQLAQPLRVGGYVVSARCSLAVHDATSSSVMVKIPRCPARNGMVRRAASAT